MGRDGLWAFLERLGSKLDFEAGVIGTLLSITLLFATGGLLLTAWLGERHGNVKPYYLSCLAMLMALVLLDSSASFNLYAAGTCLLTFATGIGFPFAVAEIAQLDPDGRFIILSVPAIGLGAMAGPCIAGALGAGRRRQLHPGAGRYRGFSHPIHVAHAILEQLAQLRKLLTPRLTAGTARISPGEIHTHKTNSHRPGTDLHHVHRCCVGRHA